MCFFCAISIHVPRVEDDKRYACPCGHLSISIHVPRVEDDLGTQGGFRGHIPISIHVPRVEDDYHDVRCDACQLISIHVPRVEDDIEPLTLAQLYFNPRPPCGGRHVNARYARDFNPRPPCGGRLEITDVRFQSTSPVWRTTIRLSASRRRSTFQSTSPVWRTTRDEL